MRSRSTIVGAALLIHCVAAAPRATAQLDCQDDALYAQCPSLYDGGASATYGVDFWQVYADRFTMPDSARVTELHFWATESVPWWTDALTVRVELFEDSTDRLGARIGHWTADHLHGDGRLTSESAGYSIYVPGWHDDYEVLRYRLSLTPDVELRGGARYWLAVYWDWEATGGFALRVLGEGGDADGRFFHAVGWLDEASVSEDDAFALWGERLTVPPAQPCPPGRPRIDCNGNGVDDACDIRTGRSADCDSDGVPDDCVRGTALDCDANYLPDACDISSGRQSDCDGDGVIDECQPNYADCNRNGAHDGCDIQSGVSEDCNSNGVPDTCDQPDINGNDIPDECEPDCNHNSTPDSWELRFGWVPDRDGDGVPDRCQCPGDVGEDGFIDLADLNGILGEFGSASPTVGDRDFDGDVDIVDLNSVLAHFNEFCP